MAHRVAAICEALCKIVTLVRTRDGQEYVCIDAGDHRETYDLQDQKFKDWAILKIQEISGRALTSAEVDAVIESLEVRARLSGKRREVHLRTAFRKGRYYIDLCDERWRCIEVQAGSWRVLKRAPVLFRRSTAMRPLSIPERKGKLGKIFEFANIAKSDRLLVLAWLLECFRPNTPYVGLGLAGMQGSAKSSTQNVLCSLVDPSKGNLRVAPRKRDDVFAAVDSSLLVSFENMSKLTAQMQDDLCSMLTGGEFSARKLYTNIESVSISIKRPVVINGIARVVTAPDLTDRFIYLDLPTLPEGARRAHADLEREFARCRATIFGAMLNRFARALTILPDVQTEERAWPRMVDFAQLGEAVARSLGHPPGHFVDVYSRRRRLDTGHIVAESLLGSMILELFGQEPNGIFGTYADVSAKLQELARCKRQRLTKWPATGKAFGDELRRLTPALRQNGVEIRMGLRTKRGYACEIRRPS